MQCANDTKLHKEGMEFAPRHGMIYYIPCLGAFFVRNKETEAIGVAFLREN